MEKNQESDSESFAVLEMPIGLKSIHMVFEELRRFCREYRLPVFRLVEVRQVVRGVDAPLQTPRHIIFTLKWDWCLWAVERLPDRASGDTDVEKAQQLLDDEGYEMLPPDAEGQIGFRRKDGKVAIV